MKRLPLVTTEDFRFAQLVLIHCGHHRDPQVPVPGGITCCARCLPQLRAAWDAGYRGPEEWGPA